MSEPEATFRQHFSELKSYLRPVAAAFLLSFVAAFYLSPHLINYVKEVTAVPLIAIHPYEILMTQVRIGFYAAIIMTIPTASIQLYRFFKPAMTPEEERTFMFTLPVIFLLTLAGAAMGFVFLSEMTSEFLRGLATGTAVVNNWTISNVISYMMKLSLSAAIIFNIPVFVVALVHFDIVDVELLKQYRRHIIVASVAFAAMISPPDFLSMMFLSLPTYVSYEVGIKASSMV